MSFDYYDINNKPTEHKDPLYYFTPSVAVNGLISIKNLHPKWNNNLLIGSLKDESLHRFVVVNNRLVNSERIKVEGRVRDFLEHDSKIFISYDGGKIGILTPTNKQLYEINLSPVAKCTICHAFDNSGEHKNGPNLYKLFNRNIASYSNFPYSESLLARGADKWSGDLLLNFLTKNSIAPQTSMPYINLSKDELLEIINYFDSESMQGDKVLHKKN